MSVSDKRRAAHDNRTAERVSAQGRRSAHVRRMLRMRPDALRSVRHARVWPTLRSAALAFAVLALVACQDMGVQKAENLPLEVARTQGPKPLVQQTMQISREPPTDEADEPIQIAGQWWQTSAAVYALPVANVRPVGSAGAVIFYALAWDSPPYDRLLVQERPGAWRELLEVR